MSSDVAVYIGQCFLALSLGLSGGLIHRHFIRVAESLASI
jgi:hypothetical protein